MPLPPALAHLPLPIIGAPLFIIRNPKLVIAQCKAGVVGSMPALNARPASQLDEWLAEITETLAAHDRDHPEAKAAPFAINQIVHKTNDRLENDMEVCARYKVPIVITSLGARTDINDAVHAWGGVVLHDIINNMFARKAVDKGADGVIAVAAGAGGHAGVKSPFALVQETRAWFDGPMAGLRQQVLAHDDGALTLDSPLAQGLAPGMTARLRQGCDHSLQTCETVFANAANFRGEPFLPGNDLLARYPRAQ